MIKQANVVNLHCKKIIHFVSTWVLTLKKRSWFKGVIIGIDAEIMMAMANALGSELKFLLVCMAIGNVTKAAAALLIG